MQKRRIQKKTCFMMGLVGAVVGFLGGVLRTFGLGEVSLLRMISMVLYGAMLLFLATTEKGDENRSRRIWLLVLFLALLVSWFELPLLCPPLEAIVVPGVALLYKIPQNRLPFRVLVPAEALYVILRTVLIMPSLAAFALPLTGAGLALVSAARFWLLFNLHRHAAAQPDAMKDTPAERLKPNPFAAPMRPERKRHG